MSLASWFGKAEEIGKVIAALWPNVVAFVKQVEQDLAGEVGATKLAAVQSLTQSVFSTIDGLTVTFEDVWPKLSGIVSVLVTLYNASGLFHKASASPSAPQA